MRQASEIVQRLSAEHIQRLLDIGDRHHHDRPFALARRGQIGALDVDLGLLQEGRDLRREVPAEPFAAQFWDPARPTPPGYPS